MFVLSDYGISWVSSLIFDMQLTCRDSSLPLSTIFSFRQNTEAYVLDGQSKEWTIGQSVIRFSSPSHFSELTPIGLLKLPNADP